MTTSVTPTAIDAFVAIESIRVVGRHRKDLGDLTGLTASIEDLGMLLNPITLDRDGRLVAGQRRLEACRRLGWDSIPVRFIDSLDDAAKLLRAERDENTERKEMLPSELGSLGAALERMVISKGDGTTEDHEGKTTEIVGPALGMSGRTYQELAYVHRVATDDDSLPDEKALAKATLAEMDSSGSIAPPARRLRGALRAKRDAQEAKAAALADPEPEQKPTDDDPNWIPSPHANTQRAIERRRDLVQQLADEGLSSYQIADRIGVGDARVRGIARENGIRLPADEAMGRGTRKKIDSNRIVRETVASFAGLDLSLRLINYDDLDRSEIKDWADSLTESIRLLNRLKNRLKEMAQ